MNSVQLAWRVLRVDRRTQVSTTLTALGVAVATGLVLLLVSLPFATQARAERTLWQETPYSADKGGHLSVATSTDEVDGQTITRVDVAPLDDQASAALPAGIDRLPAPGEMVQSPELAQLAANRPARELADRFGAKPAGLLGMDALMYPEQLVVLVGHTPDTMPINAVELPRLGGDATAEPDVLLSLLAGVGVVVLLVPSLVLVASASRLTAARRERRLAALRLAGATPAQVTAMVAAETGVAALGGAVIGIAVSPVLHALATWVSWGGGTWFAGDFSLPWYAMVLVALVVPVLVVGAAVLGLRRVVRTPLMATGGHTPKPLSWTRLAIVPVAIALFFWTLTSTNLGNSATPVLLSLGLLMWSPTIVGPWVTSALGGVFTKVWRKPAVLLAGRRLRDDPRAAYRASAGVVLAVFAGSMALTLMPSLEAEAGYSSQYRDSVLYLSTDPSQAPAVVAAADRGLERYGLAQRASAVGYLQVRQGSEYLSAYVVSCADAEVLMPVTVSCGAKPAIYAPSSGAIDMLSYEDSGGGSEEKVPLPGSPVTSAGLGMVLIDPALLPADAPLATVDVAVPASSSSASRESARTALLAASEGAQVISKEMKIGDQNTQLADLRRVTVIGLVTAALLGGLSAAIATAGSVMDRRRTFGALMAAGTPVRTLSRALRAEAALPALVATVGAGALGTAVGIGLFGLVSRSVAVLSPWLLAPIVLGALVAVLAASVCTPALKRVRAEPLADE